ncbi:hypothetical protein BD770DRAFT_446725 [Pilaira anomala]|nr:hypothetical protein BD770DRAFT_446725 [Pilaira anomala]
MNWNVKATDNSQIDKPTGAFIFHTPTRPGDESDDSYQTIDEDDDEYEPLSITGWGDTAVKEEEEEPANWNSLIDSSIKVKAGGIGSGNLHRRGGNFRPLSEEHILAQRLSKPIPGKKSGASKSRGGKKKKAGASVASRPPARHSTKPPTRPPPPRATAFARKAPPAPYVPPERARPANAPVSSWSQAPLVETPFWESQKPKTPLPQPTTATNTTTTSVPAFTAPSTSFPVLCETPFWETAKKPIEPTIITTETKPVENQPQLPQPTTTTTTTTTNASKWNVDVPGFQPSPKKTFNPGVPAFSPKAAAHGNSNTLTFNPNIPSFNPTPTTASQSSSSTTSSSTVKTVFNTNVPEFLPFVQLATPKPVKITPATTMAAEEETPKRNTRLARTANPLLLKQLQNINSGLSNQPKTTNKVSSVTEGIDSLTMESQTGPESTRGLEEPQPLLQINLELAPGISTEVLVFSESKPEDLVEAFASKHKLNITNTAKSKLAKTIELLIKNKKEALGL